MKYTEIKINTCWSPSHIEVRSGLIIIGPKNNKNRGINIWKNNESKTMVYSTMVIDFEVGNDSFDKKNNATAEPPILVGDTEEENSHININSIDFLQLKKLLESNFSRAANVICLIA